MKQLKSYLGRLATSSDLNSYPDFEDKKKCILLLFFSHLFLILMVGFIIYNGINGDYSFLIANSLALLVGGVLYYLFREKKMLRFVTMFFVVVIMLLTTFFIQTGGIDRTGLYFAALIPLPAILLVGKRNGLILLMIFVLVNFLGIILFKDYDWYPNYDLGKGIRLGIVFFLISIMAYSNEFVFEYLYLRIKKLSDSLIHSQQSYKNLAVNKEHFVSLISNNLSDHLGSFAGIASLLNDEYDNLKEDQKRELIRSLANFSEQNYRLMHDLMKWSTAQTGTISYEPQPLKLEKVYRDVIDLFNPLIEEKKLSFFLKMKSNSEIFADADMAGAILRILVSNAIKFSKAEGEVRISAEEVVDNMRITVSDNGVGMSEENLMRVNSSVAFSTPGTLDEPGTGIGLILAKEFLQKNGGSLHAESTLGLGTEISFTLPLVD
ncbi:sensor histidine kinase [Mangrovibacterium lignilyticum]|uniref:sensor histidine kinase n=1 Tax=Mangrovibacterium lignilyticum TaxID=2668052 RepID=UPI0013D4FFB8|nr:HAMP domain-containing sensor histidine kinase [Mangrovibacterium lignilyticum]